MEVLGAGLEIAVALLEPGVVVRRDPEAEHVDSLRLAPEPGGQLLGDEDVATISDLETAVDRVVIRDRDEVHAPPPGELMDLLGRSCAFR
jgi:hypothetical protein